MFLRPGGTPAFFAPFLCWWRNRRVWFARLLQTLRFCGGARPLHHRKPLDYRPGGPAPSEAPKWAAPQCAQAAVGLWPFATHQKNSLPACRLVAANAVGAAHRMPAGLGRPPRFLRGPIVEAKRRPRLSRAPLRLGSLGGLGNLRRQLRRGRRRLWNLRRLRNLIHIVLRAHQDQAPP